MNAKKTTKKKGVVGVFYIYILACVTLLFLFAFAIPLLIHIDTTLYAAGDDLFSMIDFSKIQNDTIKTELQGSVDSARESIPEQVSILSYFFQYGWLIMIVIVLLVLFMHTRQNVETDYVR